MELVILVLAGGLSLTWMLNVRSLVLKVIFPIVPRLMAAI
jgi:hypothetical protein